MGSFKNQLHECLWGLLILCKKGTNIVKTTGKWELLTYTLKVDLRLYYRLMVQFMLSLLANSFVTRCFEIAYWLISLSTHLTLMTLEKKLKAIKATTFLNLEVIESSHNEGVYVTVGNPAFCLFLYLTGVHFRGELQHGGDVNQQKIKSRPIRNQEIGGASLSDVLYVKA